MKKHSFKSNHTFEKEIMPFYFDFWFGIATYSKKGTLSFEFDKASSLK